MRPVPSILLSLIVIGVFVFGWIYYLHMGAGSNSATKNEAEKQHQVQSNKTTDPIDADPHYFEKWTALEPAYQNYETKIASDGGLQSDGHTLHLYGISMPNRSQVCTYRNGERWACGQRAYIALLNLVGSTTLACRAKDTGQPDLLICRLAGIDIAEWMLRSGWAYLGDGVRDKLYVNAAATGSKLKVGIWAEHP